MFGAGGLADLPRAVAVCGASGAGQEWGLWPAPRAERPCCEGGLRPERGAGEGLQQEAGGAWGQGGRGLALVVLLSIARGARFPHPVGVHLVGGRVPVASLRLKSSEVSWFGHAGDLLLAVPSWLTFQQNLVDAGGAACAQIGAQGGLVTVLAEHTGRGSVSARIACGLTLLVQLRAWAGGKRWLHRALPAS